MGQNLDKRTNFDKGKVYQPRGADQELQDEAESMYCAAPGGYDQGPKVETLPTPKGHDSLHVQFDSKCPSYGRTGRQNAVFDGVIGQSPGDPCVRSP